MGMYPGDPGDPGLDCSGTVPRHTRKKMEMEGRGFETTVLSACHGLLSRLVEGGS